MRASFTLSALTAAFVCFATIPAIADEPPGGAPPQSATYAPVAPTADSKDEVICKSIRRPGSRILVDRVCQTRADWAYQEKSARDLTEQWQRDSAPQKTH